MLVFVCCVVNVIVVVFNVISIGYEVFTIYIVNVNCLFAVIISLSCFRLITISYQNYDYFVRLTCCIIVSLLCVSYVSMCVMFAIVMLM